MRLRFDEATEAFRAEFVAWLDANEPDPATTTERPGSSAHVPEWARRWQRTMFDAGWLVPGNPPEYGGRNATLIEQFVHQEELGRRRIYASFNPQGLGIIVPSILAFGTEEQKRRWAVPILRAEITAALGMSEPDAGSDLAGLRTRATLDGDHFVVNGQKVWTSGAHDADVILAFVRTDPDAPKHKGISVLLVPTDSPGLTRRPFGSIVGPEDLDFNEVFFDDVPVPEENLIGELNGGWRVATGSLGPRAGDAVAGLRRAPRRPHRVRRRGAARRRAAPTTRSSSTASATSSSTPRPCACWATAPSPRPAGASRPPSSRSSSCSARRPPRRRRSTSSRSSAPRRSTTPRPSAPGYPLQIEAYTASWFEMYLRSFAGTIAGGTSQIQRNIVADRVLGLPR